VSGHASSLFGVVAVKQGKAERRKAGVRTLTTVGAVEFFLQMFQC
jgi:hypothetical protein